MRPINQLNNPELIWQPRPKGHYQFDLLSGPEGAEEIVGSLLWEKSYGTLAQAWTAEGSWTFKRSGFWHQTISIRIAGTEQEIAVFERNGSNGTLRFYNGIWFRFESEGFWNRYWKWLDAYGNELMNFSSKPEWFKLKGQTNLGSLALNFQELPMLVTFGWYLVLLMAQDSASATAATTATT